MPDKLKLSLHALEDWKKGQLLLCRPGFIAKRLCPELIIVKPDFSKYTKASGEVQAVFREYDPDMEAASMDEAYLDVTDYCTSHDMPGISADTA